MADKKISALTAASTPLAGTEVLPIVQGGSTVKVAVSDLTAGRAVAANGLTSTANIRVQYSAAGNVSSVANNTSTSAGSMSQLITTNDASRSLRVQYSSSGGAGGSALTNGISTETAQVFTDGNFPIVFGTNVSAALILDTSQNAKVINNLVIGTAGKGIDFSANTHAAGMTSELLNDYEEGVWTPASGVGSATSVSGVYTKIGRQVTVIGTLTFPVQVDAGVATITGLPFASGATGSGGSLRYTDYGSAFFLYGNPSASTISFFTTGGAGISYTSISGKRVDFMMTYFV